MYIYILAPIIVILVIFIGMIIFIKSSKIPPNVSDACIKELCNDSFIDETLTHLYKLMKNEHSIYENMILSESSKETVYEINKFYNLSSCDSCLELKEKDFVIKNISRVGNLTTVKIVINTINSFYIFNNISNSIVYGNKTNSYGINIDISVELYKPNFSNSNKPLVKIDKIFLTKNTELKF